MIRIDVYDYYNEVVESTQVEDTTLKAKMHTSGTRHTFDPFVAIMVTESKGVCCGPHGRIEIYAV